MVGKRETVDAKTYVAGALSMALVVLAVTWLLPRTDVTLAAEQTPVATWTATPTAARSVEGRAIIIPAATLEPEAQLARTLETAERLLDILDVLIEKNQPPVRTENPAVAGGETAEASGEAARAISVWEDGGGCWTAADTQVVHLCGAAESDGYVMRWVGVAGDNRGPEIPDAEWMAIHGRGGDEVVWQGAHPGTGDAVSVSYEAGGHALAVRVAGRLLFRIDRLHRVRSQ